MSRLRFCDIPAIIFGDMARKLRVEVEGGLYHLIARGVLILIGREHGAAVTELSLIAGLDTSNVSRRYDAARQKLRTDRKLAYAKTQAEKLYFTGIAESQA